MDQIDKNFDVTERNRLRRLHQRGAYDAATIYPILDAALLCHVAYVIEGQPYCTPTGFWREGDALLWHGSSASRMLRQQATGIPVCLTVSHMDGLVLARSGFNHSVNYRAVMAFGRAALIEDEGEKRAAMDAFIDRYYPGRSATLRPPTAQEVKATSIVKMPIEQASAKIRAYGVNDDDADYTWPVWAGVIPLRTVVEAAQPCPQLMAGIGRPDGLAAYAPGRTLDDAMTETAREYGGMNAQL